MTENWWILEQRGRERLNGFLAEARQDEMARQMPRSSGPMRTTIANALRVLAGRLDGAGNVAVEPRLVAAR